MTPSKTTRILIPDGMNGHKLDTGLEGYVATVLGQSISVGTYLPSGHRRVYTFYPNGDVSVTEGKGTRVTIPYPEISRYPEAYRVLQGIQGSLIDLHEAARRRKLEQEEAEQAYLLSLRSHPMEHDALVEQDREDDLYDREQMYGEGY